MAPAVAPTVEQTALLDSAIRNVSHTALVDIVLCISATCPIAAAILEARLLVNDFNSDTEDETPTRSPRAPDSATSAKSSSNVLKRKRSNKDLDGNVKKRRLLEKCSQCNKEYNVLCNPSDICQWHDGELDFREQPKAQLLTFDVVYTGNYQANHAEDFWADHDEDCHGIIDDLGDEFPEGFIWTCCKKDGYDKGCHIGRHRCEKPLRIRGRDWRTLGHCGFDAGRGRDASARSDLVPLVKGGR